MRKSKAGSPTAEHALLAILPGSVIGDPGSDRSGVPETGNWKLEAGSWKLEAGSWKLEAGSWKLETTLSHQHPRRAAIGRRELTPVGGCDRRRLRIARAHCDQVHRL